MTRRRNDGKSRKLPLLSLLLVLCLCPGAHAGESWTEYRMTAEEGKLSYDPKSIETDDGVVDVWSRFEPAADPRIREMKHLVRFDCARKKMKLLRTITVNHNGSVVEIPQKNKFEAIEPGSNPAILGALVCGGKNEPQPAPQETVAPQPAAPVQSVPQEPAAAPAEKSLQEVPPTATPVQAVPQEPAAPAGKPVHDVPQATAPAPEQPQEPLKIPVEKLPAEIQAPVAPQQQETSPAQTPPADPAALPQ